MEGEEGHLRPPFPVRVCVLYTHSFVLVVVVFLGPTMAALRVHIQPPPGFHSHPSVRPHRARSQVAPWLRSKRTRTSRTRTRRRRRTRSLHAHSEVFCLFVVSWTLMNAGAKRVMSVCVTCVRTRVCVLVSRVKSRSNARARKDIDALRMPSSATAVDSLPTPN